MADTESILFNNLFMFSFIVIAGTLAGRFAERHKFPRTIPLIVTGIAIIAVNSLLREPFFNLGEVHEVTLFIAELALIVFLFKEGMHLDLRATKKYIGTIFLIATIGTVVSTFVIGIIATLVFSPIAILLSAPYILPLTVALLIGAIFTPTDPAATFTILRSGDTRINEKFETILGGESAFNDVFAIILVQVIFIPLVAAEGASEPITLELGDIVLETLRQFFGGVLIGLVIGWFTLRLLKRLSSHLEESFVSLSAAVLVFAAGHVTDTSGAIGALVAGIVLANPTIFRQEDYFKRSMFRFWDEITWIFEVIAFILVGTLFSVSAVNPAIVMFSIILAIIVIAGRFIGIFIITGPLELHSKFKDHFNNNERFFTGFAGMKGLTTAILALMAYIGLSDDLQAIGFIVYTTIIVLIVTGLVQGLFLKNVAKKTGVLALHDELDELVSERIVVGAKLEFILKEFEQGRITANQYRLLSIPLKEKLIQTAERILVLRAESEQAKKLVNLLIQQNDHVREALKEARVQEEIDEHYFEQAIAELDKEKKEIELRRFPQ